MQLQLFVSEYNKEYETNMFIDVFFIGLTRIAKGGTLYSVPIPTSPTRGTFTAIRLLIDSTHDARPHDQRFWTLFAKEILDAAQNQGRTVKKKQEIHRNAELNRAYAHFKWQK